MHEVLFVIVWKQGYECVLLNDFLQSMFNFLIIYYMLQLNLRWNKISFVTRKSFPSSQWVPYQLKHLDLSYNEMPVLSYELTFGTKSLLSLNLSHNNIDEIRKCEWSTSLIF